MKKFFSFFLLGFLAACNASDDVKVKSETATTSDAPTATVEPAYPYTPSYTSKFEIGDPNHSKAILDLTKTWDNNDMNAAKNIFADSITFLTADGNEMFGSADSLLKATMPYRNSLGTVNTKVHAWVPLKATDKNENWVCIWYTEYHKKPDGKMDSTEFQDTWRLNNAGKPDLLMQYERKILPAKK